MIHIGILGGAEIALRRFMPALQKASNVLCAGVASHSVERRERFRESYGVPIYEDYAVLLELGDIDAVYLPLPPALHFEWAYRALEQGKHVFLEKPSTDSLAKTELLVKLARKENLVLHENYMFQYHSQLSYIFKLINEGSLGEIKIVRAAFTFPMRVSSDFRYQKSMGGGALLDAGGYVAKLGRLLLGPTLRLRGATTTGALGYEVDMVGSMEMSNETGMIFQGVYGFGIQYQCSLELLGSKGRAYTDRIFTAPPDFHPQIEIDTAAGKRVERLAPDDHFSRSIERFVKAVESDEARCQLYEEVVQQAELVERLKYCGGLSY